MPFPTIGHLNQRLMKLQKLPLPHEMAEFYRAKLDWLEIHVGDGEEKLSLLEEVVNKTNIPISHFHPTHINRTENYLGPEFNMP